MAAADPQIRIATLEAALRTASRELHWAQFTIQKKEAEIQQLLERLRKQRVGFLVTSPVFCTSPIESIAKDFEREWGVGQGPAFEALAPHQR